MRFRITRHAQEEMERRGIPLETVQSILNNPRQVVPEREGKKAYQSVVVAEEGKKFLVRVIVDDAVDPAAVVTVYRTSKVEKYWSGS